MRSRDRTPPALKHGAYSATAILPGESQAEFEKLHRDTIAEFTPSGVLENDIVMTLTRLLWRKQNLDTLHIAEHARRRCGESTNSGEKTIRILFDTPIRKKTKNKGELMKKIGELKKKKGKRGFGKSMETITNWLSLAKPPRLTD